MGHLAAPYMVGREKQFLDMQGKCSSTWNRAGPGLHSNHISCPTCLPEMQELKYVLRCPNHHRSKDLCLKLLWGEFMTNSHCYYNPKRDLTHYGQDFQGCTAVIHLIPHMSMVIPGIQHLLSPPEGISAVARPL